MHTTSFPYKKFENMNENKISCLPSDSLKYILLPWQTLNPWLFQYPLPFNFLVINNLRYIFIKHRLRAEKKKHERK